MDQTEETGGFIVKEYFISEINIEKLYHLSNITIELDTTKRQHLLLTGKNGSGKTSLLLRLVRYLKVLKRWASYSINGNMAGMGRKCET